MSRLVQLALAALAALALVSAAPISVETTIGTIIGEVDEHSAVFRGIPYAQSTAGANRFRRPVAAAPFTKPFEALDDGPGCPQDCHLPPHTCPETISEDCLFLNVFTPVPSASAAPMPVMVFFHGGNYKQGTAGGPLYNGTAIAEQGGVIVVTVNYRLGALGFLTLPDIPTNIGLYDQRQALIWVRSHISAFGGDESRVTIFGQSAGAGSVASHLVAQVDKAPFSQAIMLSNPFDIPLRTEASVATIAAIFLEEAGCKGAGRDCLVNVPLDDLIAAQVRTEKNLKHTGDSFLHAFLPWTPVVDGEYLPEQPLTALHAGYAKNVPVMIGTVSDEAVPFIYEAAQKPVNSLGYLGFIGIIFGMGRAAKILDAYPAHRNPSTDHREKLVTLGNEFIFECSTRNASMTLSMGRNKDVYVYSYDHAMSFGPDAWGPDFPKCHDRVCHAAELPLLFNSAHWLFDYTEEENVLARKMVQYFANFAHTGNPNRSPDVSTTAALAARNPAGASLFRDASAAIRKSIASLIGETESNGKLETWPTVDEDNGFPNVQVLRVNDVHTETRWSDDRCRFWDDLGYLYN